MTEVSDLPHASTVGKPARLNYLVEELMENPGVPFLLYEDRKYSKVGGRASSFRKAIDRMGLDRDLFTVRTTKEWKNGNAALFGQYNGKAVR